MKRNQHLRFVGQSCLTLLLAAVSMPRAFSAEVPARSPAVDPAATQILRRMTDYLGSLTQFSMSTQNTLEDLHDGHKVDLSASAHAIICRPNRMFAEQRLGDLTEQNFYYDGKTLTLSNPGEKFYATEPAPGTIEGMLNFVRDSLGLVVPAADMLYSNSFSLLMQDVTLARVVGKAFLGGVKCDQLLFSRPGVDFQVWVEEGDRPLPRQFVVTDTTTCLQPSLITVISDWNVAPTVADDQFTFVPPEGARRTTFLPLHKTSGSKR